MVATNDCGSRASRKADLSRRSPLGEGGFTLVEVLVATVILTIALVSMAELMAITLRMQMIGKNETSAVRLAQSKIDELVSVSFTGAAAATVAVSPADSLDTDQPGYFDSPPDATGVVGNFKRRWRIEDVSPYTNVRQLTVRIIPTVNDRRTNAQIELVTFIRNPAGLGL